MIQAVGFSLWLRVRRALAVRETLLLGGTWLHEHSKAVEGCRMLTGPTLIPEAPQ